MNHLDDRGSSPPLTFHAVVTSGSGHLWPEVKLLEVVTSTHCFSSGDLMELEDTRGCMSQIVVVEEGL